MSALVIAGMNTVGFAITALTKSHKITDLTVGLFLAMTLFHLRLSNSINCIQILQPLTFSKLYHVGKALGHDECFRSYFKGILARSQPAFLRLPHWTQQLYLSPQLLRVAFY